MMDLREAADHASDDSWPYRHGRAVAMLEALLEATGHVELDRYGEVTRRLARELVDRS